MTYVKGNRISTLNVLHAELVTELTKELGTKPLQETPDDAKEPIIKEEQLPRSDVLHVYVIWKRWKDVNDEVERSAIILDAYEQKFGKDVSHRIGVAMGVTRSEAEMMGLIIR